MHATPARPPDLSGRAATVPQSQGEFTMDRTVSAGAATALDYDVVMEVEALVRQTRKVVGLFAFRPNKNPGRSRGLSMPEIRRSELVGDAETDVVGSHVDVVDVVTRVFKLVFPVVGKQILGADDQILCGCPFNAAANYVAGDG